MKKGIKSVEVAARVLDALSHDNHPVRLKDLAENVGIPPSRLHSYMVSLCRTELVTQHGKSGRYQLGPKALQFGLNAFSKSRLFNLADEAADDLYDEIGLTVVMAVWNTNGPVVVKWRHGLETLSVNTGLGSTLALLTTAIGRVFLAYSDPDATRDLLEAERAALADSRYFRDLADAGEIERMVATVRQNGYARIHGILSPRMVAYAAPVFHSEGRIFASIAILDEPGPNRPERATGHIKRLLAAADISTSLQSETDILDQFARTRQ